MTDRLDDLEARVEALSRGRLHNRERIEELERENERLQDEVAKLKAVVNTDPEKVSYDSLTRERKVHRIRSKLVEIAENTNGKAGMNYKDIVTLFDGHPSIGHAYDLMEAAANTDGFAIGENQEGVKRIDVVSDDVNDLAVFHAANNGTSEEAI